MASYEYSSDRVLFKGPFLKLSEEASDSRFTIWGNQGFLFRYTLLLLERKHKIFNIHGCALFHQERNRLYLIVGGAGSGKTVYLLSGLGKGLREAGNRYENGEFFLMHLVAAAEASKKPMEELLIPEIRKHSWVL